VVIEDGLANIVVSQSFDANHPGLFDWQQQTIPLALASGTYTLTFFAEGSPTGLDTLLDNVSLDTAATAVPEPSSCAVFLAGIAGLFAYRRRAKKAFSST
jgi:hypothetical protein